ncbi:methionine--tRNA ligase [Candidatus Kuenenbacteria bacterium HGW-Kuenenbacteria-1]|uniref:Methionine--tRNA ligase n=1 Tax=Candidatus Kuenenbacteria bacterium HGW-Kuenenbacteria-1 TaxID=2013812 RepID=A0A2N1UMT0_9BACT|nr:MAG: methionine--tRNA ligase [Candidatus Kuenenbacteria bacterium HGW-Kuenenbacteria-1]
MKFYITTPIYYVNDEPHLGHAYTTVITDVLARYHRLKGDDVFFLTGTDEHGLKIEQKAQEEKMDPQKFCDKKATKFQFLWNTLNISNDNFIRTTDLKHKNAVQKVLQILFIKKMIYKGEYQGLYCVGCEEYKTKTQLVDGKCPFHQKEPELLKEECYFFKLSNFQKELIKKIQNNEFKIEPIERKNEILGFLKKEKLEDLSISRKKVRWGIPLPFDEFYTIYVWVEAFFNYLTGLDWQGDNKKVSDFWSPDVQIIGKDILRLHATVWPALLLALNIPLPKKLFVHGFFTFNGQKMSKTLGNVIWPNNLIDKFGVDATRYLLLSQFPLGQDGDIAINKLEEKYNADLVNGLGNLVSRVLTLAERNPSAFIFNNNEIKIKKTWEEYEKTMENIQFFETLKIVLGLISFYDKYIEQEKPWEIKNNLEKLNKILSNLLEGIYCLGIMILPFMPEISEKIFIQLGIEKEIKHKSFEELKKIAQFKFKIKKNENLFPKENLKNKIK